MAWFFRRVTNWYFDRILFTIIKEVSLSTKANLMTYNTFTFKTKAQMLLHTKIWEDNGTALFSKLKKGLHKILLQSNMECKKNI